jgi:predicted RNA-binding protein YlxR (DUF448 family)
MLARVDDSVLDGGPRAAGSGTERMCVATREVKPTAEMIRFVVGPDGTVVPDLRNKLPGRGVWVTATRAALAQAIKRKAFGAGFKRDLRVDAGLIDLTERLMERAVLDALAICGKAGLAVAGFAKVEAALARGSAVALIHAADGAADGVRKLNAMVRREHPSEAPQPHIIREFSSDQLDLALGRPNVVHAALTTGSASETCLARHARLMRFRAGNSPMAGEGQKRLNRSGDKERNV